MTQPPLLQVSNLGCKKGTNQPIFSNLNMTLNEGEVLVLQGKSGSG
jgi:ABC-type transport system involved in cytochrome c biogenesis ATPase subunit